MILGITKSEAARRMGVAPSSLGEAVRTGRVTPLADGSIDPDTLAEQWGRNGDPRLAEPTWRNFAPAGGGKKPPGRPARSGTLVEARTQREWLRVRQLEVELETALRERVPLAEVVAGWQAAIARCRSLLLGIANHFEAPEEQRRVRRLVEGALRELADTRVDADPDGEPGTGDAG